MSLPYTQIVFDVADTFFGTDPFWTPDRSKIAFFGTSGSAGFVGYRDGLDIFDNSSKTRTDHFEGISGTDSTDPPEGIFPGAIFDDGAVYGVSTYNSFELRKFNSGTLQGDLIAGTPGEIQNPGIWTFDCPDDHPRLVVAKRAPTIHTIWLHRPDDGSWEVVTQDLTAHGLPLGDDYYLDVIQDVYGDLWGVRASAEDTVVFWRIKEFGDNPDTIADIQEVTGLPGWGTKAFFTPSGALVCCAGSGGSTPPYRYLVRISGTGTDSWAVAQTKDFGSDYSFNIDPDYPRAADTSLWVMDYRVEGFSTPDRIATEISCADLTELRSANLDDWLSNETDGDLETVISFDYSTPALICTNPDTLIPTEDYGPGSISWRYWAEGEGTGGDGTTDDDLRIRVWTYSLDGHDFYVLRLGPSETLVYDLTTSMWSSWASPGRDNWRAHIGANWVGMSADTLDRGFGSDVVAGDDATGVLWILDPTTGRDDRSTTGTDSFNRIVTGGVQLTGRDVVPCNAVQIDLSIGSPTQTGATISLEVSDDLGNSFVSAGSVAIAAGDYTSTVEFRSLGTMKSPGRIFRITDNGATVRLSGADMR